MEEVRGHGLLPCCSQSCRSTSLSFRHEALGPAPNPSSFTRPGLKASTILGRVSLSGKQQIHFMLNLMANKVWLTAGKSAEGSRS